MKIDLPFFYRTYRHKPEKRRDSTSGGGSASEKRSAIGNNSLVPPTPQPTVRPTTPNLGHHSVLPSTPTTPVSYNLQHMGAGTQEKQLKIFEQNIKSNSFLTFQAMLLQRQLVRLLLRHNRCHKAGGPQV